MSIEFTIPSPKIQTSIENDAEVVVDVLDGDAKMFCDVQQCDAEVSAEITNDAEMNAFKATHTDIIVSLVCAVDIDKKLILVDKNTVPIITIDGQYIYLNKDE
jgi:hypothetical protein